MICHGCAKEIPSGSSRCPFCGTVYNPGYVQAPRQGSFKTYPAQQAAAQEETYTEAPPNRKRGFSLGVAIAIVLVAFIVIVILVIGVVVVIFLIPVEQTLDTTTLDLKATDCSVYASEKGNASSFEVGEQMIRLEHQGGEMRSWDSYLIWIYAGNGSLKVEAQILTISGTPYRAGLQSGIGDVLIIGVKDAKDNGVIKANNIVRVEIEEGGKTIYRSSEFTVK